MASLPAASTEGRLRFPSLKEIGPLLVNIHGQHESYGLLSPENHLAYLDSMGLPQELADRYSAAFGEAKTAPPRTGFSQYGRSAEGPAD